MRACQGAAPAERHQALAILLAAAGLSSLALMLWHPPAAGWLWAVAPVVALAFSALAWRSAATHRRGSGIDG